MWTSRDHLHEPSPYRGPDFCASKAPERYPKSYSSPFDTVEALLKMILGYCSFDPMPSAHVLRRHLYLEPQSLYKTHWHSSKPEYPDSKSRKEASESDPHSQD